MTDKIKSLVIGKKRKNESIQKEERDSDRERKVAIFRKDSIIIIYVKKIFDLFYILEGLNMPYYFNSGKKIYFNYDKNLYLFWSKKENKILYESDTTYKISYDSFLVIHENILPKNIHIYKDFCYPYYYFSENEKEQFVQNLNEEVIDKLKYTRNFDDYKIVRFFGPKKNGKSTIVYYYFGMRRYIPINEMFYIEDINNTKKFNPKDPKYDNKDVDENSEEQSDIIDKLSDKIINEFQDIQEEKNDKKYFIKIDYGKDFKKTENLEANSELSLLNDKMLEDLNIFSKVIDEDNNEEKIRNIKKVIFNKEFYFTLNDTIGFFRSCYLNHKFLQSNESEDLKLTTLEFEFSGLFKSYKVYQFFIAKFKDFYSNTKSIIDIGEFIINFFEKYKTRNIRFFIILDGITKDLIAQLNNLEDLARKVEKCFLFEIFENEGINEKFENEVINNKIKSDELVIYRENYCEYDDSFNLNGDDKIFLSNNFNKNLYYYQMFINWRNQNKSKEKKAFLNEIQSRIEADLLSDFSSDEEGKIFLRYLYINVLNNTILNSNIIKKLNLDYFFIENNNGKNKLLALPFIEKILKNLSETPLKNVIYEDYFIKLEEYIKGGIFEDIIKNEIKELFYNNAKNKEDFQEINIKRLVDNEIYTFYSRDYIEKILKSKKSFISLKSKLEKENFKFGGKITILFCVQNARHYDLGVLFYDVLFIFQITINKSKIDIEALLEYLDVDVNYITNKLEFLTNEQGLFRRVYAYLVNIDFQSIYEKKALNEMKKFIFENINKNNRMKKALENKNIQIVYCSKNCELYDKNLDKIGYLPTKFDKNIYSNISNKSIINTIKLYFKINNATETIKKSKKLAKYILKDSVQFYSLLYPGLKLPENFILYYTSLSSKFSFFKIEKNYYDSNLEKMITYDKINNINSFFSHERTIFVFIYEKIKSNNNDNNK